MVRSRWQADSYDGGTRLDRHGGGVPEGWEDADLRRSRPDDPVVGCRLRKGVEPVHAARFPLHMHGSLAMRRRQVEQMANRASERERLALKRQLEAARLRLKRELGRYLACLGLGTEDLNAILYQQMTRDIAAAGRLRNSLEKLGGYPEWEPELIREFDHFAQALMEGQRRARLLGKEIDAALEDPRWECASRITGFCQTMNPSGHMASGKNE